MFCWSLAEGQGAREKAILEVVPSLAELGDGWTTNAVVSLLDPLSRPWQIEGQTGGKGQTNFLRTTPKTQNPMGWGRFCFGRGDMVLNRGAYFVSIQRWGETNALDKAWKGWETRPDYTLWRGPPIGEGCYWTQDDKFHGVTFRRGLFHVVITCGAQSDHSGLFRLAEVTDAKIAGRPIPAAEEEPGTDEPADEVEPVTK